MHVPSNDVKELIDTFRGPLRFLSNFYRVPEGIRIDEHTVPTVEHAYQMAKVKKEHWPFLMGFSARNVASMKRESRNLTKHPLWDEESSLRTMRALLRQKFKHGSNLGVRLMRTGHAYIVEGNYWHDNFWGECTCTKCEDVEKLNNLGQLLMLRRTELQAGPDPVAPPTLTKMKKRELHDLAKEKGMDVKSKHTKNELIDWLIHNDPNPEWLLPDQSLRPLWWRRMLAVDSERRLSGKDMDYPTLAKTVPSKEEEGLNPVVQFRFNVFEEVCKVLDAKNDQNRAWHLRQLGNIDEDAEQRVRTELDKIEREETESIKRLLSEETKQVLEDKGVGVFDNIDACHRFAVVMFDSGQARGSVHVGYHTEWRVFMAITDQTPPPALDVQAIYSMSRFCPGYKVDLSMRTPGYIKCWDFDYTDPITGDSASKVMWAMTEERATSEFIAQVPGVKMNEVEITETSREFAEAKVYDTVQEAEIVESEFYDDGVYDGETWFNYPLERYNDLQKVEGIFGYVSDREYLEA